MTYVVCLGLGGRSIRILHASIHHKGRQKNVGDGHELGLWVLRHGFCKFILCILRTMEYGMLVGGPPCGSFVWVNRHTSQRSKTRPFGCALPYVKHANQQPDCMCCHDTQDQTVESDNLATHHDTRTHFE